MKESNLLLTVYIDRLWKQNNLTVVLGVASSSRIIAAKPNSPGRDVLWPNLAGAVRDFTEQADILHFFYNCVVAVSF